MKEEALRLLLKTVRSLGAGYYQLTKFKCTEALQEFESIPIAVRSRNPWIIAQSARAHFEQGDYDKAITIFEHLRKVAPGETEYMDLFSTALWHRARVVDLAYLARVLSDLDRLSPEALCAQGNAFSLNGDHENALECFRRATQVAPRQGYAFALLGHEYRACEDLQSAVDSYRRGLAVNHRMYNALFGLGQIHFELGNPAEAKLEIEKASKINPQNATIQLYLGKVCALLPD